MPESWRYRATAAAGDWLEALAVLAAARERGEDASELPRTPITLSPAEKSLTLRAGGVPSAGRRVGWEASASFAADFAVGEGILTFAANPLYVEQAVRALRLPEDAGVEFAANGDANPFRLQAAGSASTWVVTMPLARDWPPRGAG